MRGLKGKVAVVVGGGRGIGRAIAEQLADYGCSVVVGSRTLSEVENTALGIRNAGGSAHGLSIDVQDRSSVSNFADEAFKLYGRADILVYCAGINQRLSAEEYPEETWSKVIDINLTGAYRTCQEFGQRMIAQGGGGSIVTITSMMSHVVTPKQSAYSASKGALMQYTKLLAVEWAKNNIRVNAVSPGYIETEMTKNAIAQSGFRNAVLEKTPMERFGAAAEIAQAVCFLASPEASFITGAILPVDGGFLAGHPAIIPS